MRISHKLALLTALPLVLSLIVAAIALTAHRALTDSREIVRIAEELETQVFALGTLTRDYLRRPNERAREQRRQVYEALGRTLAQARHLNGPALLRLQADHRTLGNLFTQLDALQVKPGQVPVPLAAERESWLAAQLLLRSQDAFSQAEKLRKAAAHRIDRQQAFYVSSTVAVLALAGAFGGVLAWRTSTGIRRSLSRLRQAAAVMASGNLDYRADTGTRDEHAELAQALNTMAENLARDIRERKRAEKQAKERMKELQALYRLSAMAERKDFALDRLYQELANVLPQSWQYPDTACARIVMGEIEFRTANFAVSEWMQTAPIEVYEAVVGKVEVGYLERKPEENEGPFLTEERQLIVAIAERVGQITELKRAEEALRESEERFRAIFDWVNDAIFIHDMTTGAIIDVNRRMCEMYGYSHDEALKLDIEALSAGTPPYSQRDALRWLEKAAHGEPQTFEWRAKDKAGRLFWVEVAIRHARLAGHDRLLVSVRDISERKRTERALQESEERYRSVVAALFEGVILMDADGAIRASNASAARILGLTVDQLAGLTPFMHWQAIHEDGSSFPGETHPVWVTLQTGEPCHDVVMGVRKPDGTLTWLSINSQPLYRPGDIKPHAAVASFADITERKRAEEELQVLQLQLREEAIRDPLTGLFNRRYLAETLTRELARDERDRRPLSILMGDVDYFKRLNDAYGHAAGDEVLRTLGRLLQRHARSSDIPCRYGGEEFLLVLPDTPPEVARERAELLRQDFADLRIAFGGAELVATLSIGVSGYPRHGKTADELIRAADLALYEAKQSGRNRVCYARPSDH